jgi:hypothetical protein
MAGKRKGNQEPLLDEHKKDKKDKKTKTNSM